LHPKPEPDPIFEDDTHPESSLTDTIMAHKTQQTTTPAKYPPHDIRSILSQKKGPKRDVNVASIMYLVSVSKIHSKHSLIDRGANGGIAGNDVKVIATSDRSVDIQGINNHQVTDIKIGTVAGVITSTKRPIIGIMHQYALVGRRHSIHSPGQWEWFKHQINNKSIHIGGKQQIKTADGYIIPMTIHNGLPRLSIRPPTTHEFDTLPHVVLTQDSTWDPTVLDFDIEDTVDHWHDALEEHELHPYHELFDEYGNYKRRVTAQFSQTIMRLLNIDLLPTDLFATAISSCFQ